MRFFFFHGPVTCHIIYNTFIFIKQHEIINGCATFVLGKILISFSNKYLCSICVLSGGTCFVPGFKNHWHAVSAAQSDLWTLFHMSDVWHLAKDSDLTSWLPSVTEIILKSCLCPANCLISRTCSAFKNKQLMMKDPHSEC